MSGERPAEEAMASGSGAAPEGGRAEPADRPAVADGGSGGEATRDGGRPARGRPMRRLCAVMLSLQAVVTALAIPVAVSVSHTDGRTAGLAGGGLALLGLVIAGLLRFPWAYYLGTVFQILVIATGFVVPVMFFLGFVFAILWFTAIWVGRQAEIAQSR